MIGTKLGHYEVTGQLGAGGMGEVYQAVDSKLGRAVAIKVLPEAFTHDADRVARLQREARVLASLNHPNIASIYGLELAGEQNFLVMELVPGETLAERIRRGPIPPGEALGIATQIAAALEAAHEKGVIHRDLKPANVKVTPEGAVKVLDFGLAKAFETDSGTANISNSPTLSIAATQQGVVLGTAAYMSPEQAKGRPVDPRTDIFAFGAVLFEMLTGRPAFDGEDVPDILGAVLRTDPDWALLPPQLAPMLSRLLRLCLQKDAKKRRQTATDLRIDLEEAKAMPHTVPVTVTAEVAAMQRAPGSRRLIWAATGALGLILGSAIVLALWSPWRTPDAKPSLRMSVELGTDSSLAPPSTLALSPNGTLLVFSGLKNGERQLYLRRLDQMIATPLAGTTGASDPFFSPDGEWIAFSANGKLKKIATTGGASVELADAPNLRGGSWGDDDHIIFSPNNTSNVVLMRVPAAGGNAKPLTKLENGEVVHRWPQVLPGASAVLYTAHTRTNGYDAAYIVVQALPTGAPKILQRGSYNARYLPSGHVVYINKGTLFAASFDLDRLEMTGPPVPVVQGVLSEPGTARSHYALSGTGTLVYVPGASGGAGLPILWMGRDGKTEPLRSVLSDWSNPQFSPDGRKLALDIFEGSTDIYIYEWARDTLRRLTLENAADDRRPVWTPDGQRITFASTRNVESNLYWQKADGTGEVQRLTESKKNQLPGSWHPTGKFLAFSESNPQTTFDVMILPMEGDEKSGWKPGRPTVFVNKPSSEIAPTFSPDGRWIAYQSDESGRQEIFVRPFPGPGGSWQISTAGGLTPVWSRTRRELVYWTPDGRIMISSYTVAGDSFNADKPKVWSERRVGLRPRDVVFDIHPDGQRLAVWVAPDGPAVAPRDKVSFIFNFFDELRRVALPKK